MLRKMVKNNKLTSLLLLLSVMAYLCMLIMPHFPHFMERYYSLGINKWYREGLSLFFGIFPFSVFEWGLYCVILIILIATCYRFYHILLKKTNRKWHLRKWLCHLLNFSLIIWCLLVYTWTLNYARLPLETRLSLDLSDRSPDQLAALYTHLIERLNTLSTEVARDTSGYMIIPDGYQSVFKRSTAIYEALSKDYPMLGGHFGPPKPVTLSQLMLYTDIIGVYTPFTCEANVCVAILDQDLPATTLHELAHLRGIALEDEANFIATLAATYSEDADFKYSGYFSALIYTGNALYKVSPDTYKTLNASLNEAVRRDLKHHSDFLKAYQGPVNTISATLNDSYLKANGISDGDASYGRMVDLLVAYYQTHPDL